MKRIVYMVLCACAMFMGTGAHAYAQAPGESCETAIPLGNDFQADVQNGKSIWYSAWTFDLPLAVYFAPANGESDPPPIVEMDFSCTSGYYEDSILCSLFCKTSSSGGLTFDMPHKPSLNSTYLDDNTFVYYLSMGKQYRDLLLQVGISYNVEVFVKVTYQSDGTIAIAPDDLFNNCVDGAKFMHLGDTVEVAPLDKKRHVIVPYVQWQEDTIRYKWEGTTPCRFAVANTCDFDPVGTDRNIIDAAWIEPGDSITVSARLLSEYVHNQKDFPNEAGLYFAKFYSEEPGIMKIIKAPQAPPRGNATLLRLDRTYALNANDTNVFAIPTSWKDKDLDTKFTTPTQHMFRMMIANDPDFSEEHTLADYQFERISTGHWQGIFGTDMVEFWKQTTEQFLYIRFDCSEATTITPSEWDVSDCVKNTANYINTLDTTFTVKRASTGGNYRLNYSQWKGGDMAITFSAKKECHVYIAKDCNITQDNTAENLLYYVKFTTSNNTDTIPAEVIARWAGSVDDEGYIYARFHHTQSVGQYQMTLTSTAPAESDPTYPGATIAVACEGTSVVVQVREPQTIVITDEQGAEQDRWEAEPGTPHALTLPVGNYTLQGENEKIEIKL